MAEKEVEVIIFGLETDKDVKLEYPDLAELEEFKDLNSKQIRLCWLIGNRTSPIYRLSNKKERVQKALELTYGKDFHVRKDLKKCQMVIYLKILLKALRGWKALILNTGLERS